MMTVKVAVKSLEIKPSSYDFFDSAGNPESLF